MKKRRYWTGAKKVPSQDRFFIDALDPDRWIAGDENNWDACWHTGMPSQAIFETMTPDQWVNHIPGNHALTVKSRLHQTLDAARRRAPAELQHRYSFFPHSYLMPDDYHALQRDAFEAPDKRWIIKPKSLSRGRGISVIADAGAAPIDDKMLVQEYLKAPHLFNGRKYVLRCYLAIMSVEPLRVYLYKEGFVKLASEPYGDDFTNLYAHLTNPDVNALNEAVDDAVVFHSFADYRAWLTQHGADPAALFKGLRDIGAITAIAAQGALRERISAVGARAPGCCELIGMDCMIDADLKPWLLECNLSPSLGVCAAPETGGVAEERIKRALVADLVAMAGLNDSGRPQADQGDVRSLIAASEYELERAGGYERLVPAIDPREYFPFFPVPRYADIALADALAPGASDGYCFTAANCGEYVFDDHLALHDGGSRQVMAPSEAGAYIWLRAGAGDRPADIANDLAAMIESEADARAVALKTVWDTLADWGAAGMLGPATMTRPQQGTPPRQTSQDWAAVRAVRFNETSYCIQIASPEIAPRIDDMVTPLLTDAAQKGAQASILNSVKTISILTERAGYAIVIGPRLVQTELRLSEVATALGAVLCDDMAALFHRPRLAASLWRIGERVVLIASSARTKWDSLGALLTSQGGAELLAGGVLLSEDPCTVKPLPMPGKLAIEATRTRADFISQWPGENRGALLPLAAAPDREYSVDVIIVPRFSAAQTTPSVKPTVTPLSGRDAFKALVGMVSNDGLAGAAATVLAQWAQTAPVLSLSCSNLEAGAAAMAVAVSAPGLTTQHPQ